MPKYRIKCNERVSYDQTVTLTEKDAKQLDELYAKAESGGFKEEKELKEFVDDLVDRRDAEDSDGLEDIEIEPVEETAEE